MDHCEIIELPPIKWFLGFFKRKTGITPNSKNATYFLRFFNFGPMSFNLTLPYKISLNWPTIWFNKS